VILSELREYYMSLSRDKAGVTGKLIRDYSSANPVCVIGFDKPPER